MYVGIPCDIMIDYFFIIIVAANTTSRKYSPPHFITTKRDFISRGSCFYEEYIFQKSNDRIATQLAITGVLLSLLQI